MKKKSEKLSALEREDLKSDDFVFPWKASDAEEKMEPGNYPIPTEEYAVAALSMGKLNLSDGDYKVLEARVYKKYPELDKSNTEGSKKEAFYNNIGSLQKELIDTGVIGFDRAMELTKK